MSLNFFRKLLSLLQGIKGHAVQLRFDMDEPEKPKMMNVTHFDRKVLAATLWAEARGEKHVGRWYVAWTIRNRAELKRWWGNVNLWDDYGDDFFEYVRPHSLAAVCLYKWQYSCWNPNDPNHEKIYDIVSDEDVFNEMLNDEIFKDCVDIADRIDCEKEISPVNGATHYYNPKVCNPKWAHSPNMKFIAECGNHIFMKEV